MASKVASKIKLSSVDELLGVPESVDGAVLLEVGRIQPFSNHPFKVIDDEKMEDLINSIKENGVLNPVIVRPIGSGQYEMISGHRRLHASIRAGLEKIPAIPKQMDDDTAILAMVDSNIQREEIAPSEKGFALRMRMDAMKRQGNRSDLTSCTDCTKSPDRTTTIIGEAFGLKSRQVSNYIRLTYLNEDLLELVDAKKIPITMAVDISYFDSEVQNWLFEYIKENGFIKQAQVDRLKEHGNLENITQYVMISLMNEVLSEKKTQSGVSLSERKLSKYFPAYYTKKQKEMVILELLEMWKKDNEMKGER